MTTTRRGDSAYSFPVRMVQCQLETDHFAGVDRALAERGIAAERVFPDQPPTRMGSQTKVVMISDPFAGMNALASRQAHRAGAAVVLMMDGMVEYRNTFINPRVGGVFAVGDAGGGGFLRPAPADVIACGGEVDRRVLTALGNRAVATGLPRLSGLRALPMPADRAVLIATANQPWFTEAERGRVLESLRTIKSALERMGVRALWRVRGGLEEELGVESDGRRLRDVLADACAVITTPSTVMVEAMLARRATAVVHAHETPLWQPCAWGWRGANGGGDEPDESASSGLGSEARRALRVIHDEAASETVWYEGASEMIESLLARDSGMMERQDECLAKLDASHRGARASEGVATLLEGLCTGATRVTRGAAPFPSPVRIPSARVRGERPCVVSCVVCDDTPVGGVMTWSERLAREFSRRDLGYDVRTLLVCAKPDAWRTAGVRVATGELSDLCVIDPYADHWESLAQVRASIERIAGGTPAIVIPNYTDITYAAAMQLRASGSRTIAVAHTDEAYYQQLASTYGAWDGAVGVSHACVAWLKEIESSTRSPAMCLRGAAPRPVEWIPCVAPVAGAPRRVERTGPLKLAYVGRMVQVQKRIADLLGVVDGLEARGVSYELHMVGDGVDLPGWRANLAKRSLRTGKVVVHGRKDGAWVERFMQTIDVSVLVSEFEGTSVSMLEAMGAGVVPAVTAVRSGVSEWVTEGVTGILAPIGEPDVMAEKLAGLAADRGAIERMGRAAWEKAKRDASVERMAEKYRALFDTARARPAATEPTDLGLRLLERWRWSKEWSEDSAGGMDHVRRALREAGYRKVATDLPEPGCDAVIVRADVRPLTRIQAEQIELWRACGLGVVVAPHLRNAVPEDAMSPAEAQASEQVRALATRAAREGCERIAVYGTGKHTRRLASVFDGTLPFVGFVDDVPPAWEYMFGLPIVAFERAMAELRPDAILLSSDAWEARMWERTAILRASGVRVIPVYGTYERDPEAMAAGLANTAAAA